MNFDVIVDLMPVSIQENAFTDKAGAEWKRGSAIIGSSAVQIQVRNGLELKDFYMKNVAVHATIVVFFKGGYSIRVTGLAKK